MKLGTSLRFLYTNRAAHLRGVQGKTGRLAARWLHRAADGGVRDGRASPLRCWRFARHLPTRWAGTLFGRGTAPPAPGRDAGAPLRRLPCCCSCPHWQEQPFGYAAPAPFTSPSCLPSSSGRWPPSPRPPSLSRWPMAGESQTFDAFGIPLAQPRPPAGRADARAARTPGRGARDLSRALSDTRRGVHQSAAARPRGDSAGGDRPGRGRPGGHARGRLAYRAEHARYGTRPATRGVPRGGGTGGDGPSAPSYAGISS